MRLSYHQRVVDIIPASFAKLIPQKPQPNFRFSREDPPEGNLFVFLLNFKIFISFLQKKNFFLLKVIKFTDFLYKKMFSLV